jgi:hypothetical protein
MSEEQKKTWAERYEENERNKAVRFLPIGTVFRSGERIGTVLEISASSVRVKWEPKRAKRAVYDHEGKQKEETFNASSGSTVNVAPSLEVDAILSKEDISMAAKTTSRKKGKAPKAGAPSSDWTDKKLPASFQRSYKDALFQLKRVKGGWSVNGKGTLTIREAMITIQGGSSKGRTVSFFFKESQVLSDAQAKALKDEQGKARTQSKPKAKKKSKAPRRKK